MIDEMVKILCEEMETVKSEEKKDCVCGEDFYD